MSQTVMQWFFGGGLVIVVGLFGAILRATYKLGHDAREIKDGLQRIAKIEEQLSMVPILIVRIANVERAYEDIRSDIKDLLRRRGSRPDDD